MYLSLNPTFISSFFDYVYAKIDTVKNAVLSPFIEHTPNTSFILVASAAVRRLATGLSPALITIDAAPARLALPPAPPRDPARFQLSGLQFQTPTWVPEPPCLVLPQTLPSVMVFLFACFLLMIASIVSILQTSPRTKHRVAVFGSYVAMALNRKIQNAWIVRTSIVSILFGTLSALTSGLFSLTRTCQRSIRAAGRLVFRLVSFTLKSFSNVSAILLIRYIPVLADISLALLAWLVFHTLRTGFSTGPPPVFIPFEDRNRPRLQSPAWSTWAEISVGGVRSTVRPWDIITQEFLGKGGFGSVIKGLNQGKGKAIAVKRISMKHSGMNLLYAEIVSMNRLHRAVPHLVPRLLGSYTDQKDYILIMDFLPGGTLFTHLQCAPTGFLSRHKALFYGAQMFLGIRALHQFGVLHGDIKLDNFLLNAEGNVVVSDFGLAQLINMDDAGGPAWKHVKAQGGDGFPLLWPHADNPHQTQEPRGIAYYGAPEATAGEKYSYGADLWSWAVCFFELMTGQMPYELLDAVGLRATAARYNEYVHPPVLDLNNSANRFVFLDEVDQDFFGQMLTLIPECRMSVRELKRHPIWRGLDWDAMSKIGRRSSWWGARG